MGIRKRLEEEYDYDIVEEFIDHFDIMCGSMELAIIALENGNHELEKVHELFRIVHNIKSASGYFNLKDLNYLAQISEEVIEALRFDISNLSIEVIDWLFAVSDQFRSWYEQLEDDDENLEDIRTEVLNIPEIIWQLESD